MNRQKTIDSIQDYLENVILKENIEHVHIKENQIFFRTTRNIFSYASWLIRRALLIPQTDLKELSDLPDSNKWDALMYQSLIPAQRKKIPGLIKPPVKRISDMILKLNRNTTLLSVGSGPMELERQIIERLKKNGFKYKLIIVSVDISREAQKYAKGNLASIISKQYDIKYVQADVLNIPKELTYTTYDVVYHSLFRHHLSKQQRHKLDSICKKLGTTVIEYDGYRSVLNLLPQSIVAWKNPVFLNAAIFSNLRFPRKKEIRQRSLQIKNSKITFYQAGYYLLEY